MGGKGKRLRQREKADEKKQRQQIQMEAQGAVAGGIHHGRQSTAQNRGGLLQGGGSRGGVVGVSMWACPFCSCRNWPTRSRCNACARFRSSRAIVVNEAWRSERIPPRVAATSAENGGEPRAFGERNAVGGARGSAGSRMQPTGRVPTRFNEKSRTGCIDADGPETTRGSTRNAQELNQEEKGEERKGAEQRRRTEGGRDERDENEAPGEGRKTGDAQLPPERVFVRPPMPREALVQKLGVEEARTARLREEGASEKKLQKAEKRKEEVGEQLKAAGGKTPQSLGFQIRREEEFKKRASTAIDKGEQRIAEREQQILELQAQIELERQAQERHKQRCEAAEQRLAWLALQKAKESLPNDFLRQIRVATETVATSDRAELAPLKQVLSVLAALPQEWDISTGDTSDSSETEEWMGQDGNEERDNLEEYDQVAQEEVLVARKRFTTLQQQYNDALEQSFDNKPRAAKRAWGEDEPKPCDVQMEEEEVACLTPEQTVQFFRARLKEEQKRLERVEHAAKKEKVAVHLPCQLALAQNKAIQQPIPSSGSSSGEDAEAEGSRTRRRHGWDEDSGNDEVRMGQLSVQHLSGLQVQPIPPQELQGGGQEQHGQNQVALVRDPSSEGAARSSAVMEAEKEVRHLRRQVRERTDATIQIIMQERMQAIQDEEVQGLKRMALVRQEVDKINKRLRAKPY